jgi:hypothetical protein
MSYTTILQGSFTSDGTATTLSFINGVDWIKIYNITVADAAQTTAIGVEYKWFKGMPAGHGLEYKKSNAANAANLVDYVHTGMFTEYDASLSTLGAKLAVTAISNATIPVVTTGVNHTLNAGDIVRLIDITGAQQFGGMDFTVGKSSPLGANTFTLDYAPTIVAGTTGFYRLVPASYFYKYYPRTRYITNITQAAQAVITMSVSNNYYVGQKVRLSVPSDFGMVEMNGLSGTILATSLTNTVNSITVDIDSTAFTAFAFPLTTGTPFTPAQVSIFGENTAAALDAGTDILNDRVLNIMEKGLILGAGADAPAGQTGDLIFWEAGSSFSVNNV